MPFTVLYCIKSSVSSRTFEALAFSSVLSTFVLNTTFVLEAMMARISENLTPEQAEIFQFARNGRNILVAGQAGTGKSRVVNVIRDDCRQRGLKVAVICSSGIACQVYDRGVASTVHSYYGLGAADMSSGPLIHPATSNVGIWEKT